MDKEKKETKLAIEHVDWFLTTIRPLLISHFEHGYKHGVESIDEPDTDYIPDLAYIRIQELEKFIRNGVEFGYISVPEKGDKAREIIEGIIQSRVK